MKKLKGIIIAAVCAVLFLLALVWLTNLALALELKALLAQGIVAPTFTPLRACLIIAWCLLLLTAGTCAVAGFRSHQCASKNSQIIHDLRNSLTVFQISTEMLSRKGLSEEKKLKHIAMLKTAADSLQEKVGKVPNEKGMPSSD